MTDDRKTQLKELVEKISSKSAGTRPLTEEELSILFLSTILDEECNETN